MMVCIEILKLSLFYSYCSSETAAVENQEEAKENLKQNPREQICEVCHYFKSNNQNHRCFCSGCKSDHEPREFRAHQCTPYSGKTKRCNFAKPIFS
jgi:hypothetical protein